METDAQLTVLRRGLDQAHGLIGSVPPERRSAPTPCGDWTVADLVDHLVAAPARFAQQVRGEDVDWAAPAPPAGNDPAAAFRAGADELVGAWEQGESPMGPDMQTAEIATHTYDLAVALGVDTATLDPEVAERALALMRANLTPEARGSAFGPERPAPDGADAYQQLAAFAGRETR